MKKEIISIKSISKIYDELTDSPLKSLKSVSLNVIENEFICIMGPSGSGKTTLINCLSTIDVPTEGDVILYGKSIYDMSEKEIGDFRNKEIGFVFQECNLLDYLTVMENIAFPLAMMKVDIQTIENKVENIAKKLGISNILNKYPKECSGGQKQRAGIARALITSPKIIIADEPTGNLDTKNSNELLKMLKDLNNKKGITIIMVSHDSLVASYSSKMLYIKDGEIKDILLCEKHNNQEEYFNSIVQINSNELLQFVKSN